MPKNGWFWAAASLLFCSAALELAAAPSDLGRAARFTIDRWDTEKGLPNNEVLAITQTRDGYLWLGTLNGLVRFDGTDFTVFDESNTPGLNSGRIVKLFEDSRGNLWIGTENAGVVLMKDGLLKSVPETASGGPERRLAAICEDSQGAVWLFLANGELWRCWKGSYTQFTNFLRDNRGVRTLIAETAGPVWVGTDYRLISIDPLKPEASLRGPTASEVRIAKLDLLLASQKGGFWRLADGQIERRTTNHVDNLGAYPWGAATIAAACEDREGNLLVGTLGAGLFWFDSEGSCTPISTANAGLSHNFVLSLYVDRERTVWVGTDGGGINRVKQQGFDVLPESRGLVVQSVCEDNEAGLWLGANAGEVVYRKNGISRTNYARLDTPPSVRTVYVDRDQQVWVGTVNGGLFQLRNGGFRRAGGLATLPLVIFSIHQDSKGTLWFGTSGGLGRKDGDNWQVYTTRDGLTSDLVRAVATDSDGNLWIGTGGGGLNRLRDGKFTAFHKIDGLPSEDISFLHADEEGVLWISTSGSGLARLAKGKWTQYTKREGLISNSVGYLIEDGEGFLWIGSNRGLMRAKKKDLNDFAAGLTAFIPIRAYDTADGLPTSECTSGSQPGACRTQDGKLWFPTIKGLASLDLARLRANTNPPPVVIESVLIEGRAQNTNALRVDWREPVPVPAGKERVEIHYTSLNLAAPERARFRYRLENHEKAWTEVDNKIREVRYTALDPGRYRFQVAACNEDGVWNQSGSTVTFIVEPPFWKTWWFRSAAAAGLLAGISGAVYYASTQRLQRQLERLRQQEALEQERARIARDIHDQLGASLTQVTLLGEFVESDKDSPADVEAHARQICQTARDTTRVLDEIVWTVNPSNDTLDGLINYICKYAQEYLAVAELRYRLDVPAQLPTTPIPPELRHNVFLAAKEAVTNVVRHAKASAAWVRLKLEPNAFILEIQDNGRGLAGMDEKAASSRNGLRNMRKRMEDIGGTFTMSAAPEGGTLVRLTAPLGKK